MPTYEYRCQSCGHQFEKIQRISDPPAVPCPRCEGIAERLISGGAGVLFKGSGFYITDYRSETYKKAAKEEKGAAPAAAGEGGSSSKPAGEGASKEARSGAKEPKREKKDGP